MEEKTIKQLYNEGAAAFNKYVATHNIEQFTNDATDICKRYGNGVNACGLMLWWSARVQGLHDAYLGGANNECD